MRLLARVPFEELHAAVPGRAAPAAALSTGRAAETGAALDLGTLCRLEPPRFDADARAELARVLEHELGSLGPHVAVLEAVRALARPDAGVVLAVAEPGFLAGPLARVWAALSALRVAQSLETATERPHVALLWCAADETEPARVHPAWIRNEHDDLRRVGLASLGPGTPFGRLVLDPERHRLGAARALLLQTLSRAPHASEAVERYGPRAGETLARAFTRALLEALGPLGLVVVEPDWLREPLSRATAEVLAPRQLDRPAPLAGLWREGGGDPDAPIVRRFGVPLRMGGDGLRYDGEPGSRNLRELAAELVQEPEAFAPGAALLPLVLESCLPVVARVLCADAGGGAAPWLEPLAAWLGHVPAPTFPAFSATLVEPAVERSLERSGLDAREALLLGPALVESEAPAPSEVVRRLDELIERTTRDLTELARDLSPEDRPLAHGLRRASRRVRDELAETRQRAQRLHANRHGKSARHLRRIAGALRPRGQLQEEVLGPLPLAAWWGPDVLEEVFEHVPAVPEAHVILADGE